MFSAILGFATLLFCFAAPIAIVWIFAKTMGDWFGRAKASFAANPPKSRSEKFWRGLKS